MVNTATGSQIEKEFIKYNLEGFPLRGQDQNGNCLWLKEPVTEFKASKTYTPPTDNGVIEPLEDINEKLYLDNSVLTFEDSMLFGCSVELTFDELADFCNNQGWYNMLIFQNFWDMEQFGVSGNANPAFTNDWSNVKDEANNYDIKKEEQFYGIKGECEFPSTHEVQIYYQQIGTVQNPQYLMMYIKHEQVRNK